VPDNLRSRVDLQWPIYAGGRTDALERAARAEVDALGQDRAAAQADLKLEITRTYWALVTARASVQLLEEALTRMDAHLQDVRNRLAAGLVPPNDVLSTEAQRSRQQMLLIEARNLLESATADLRRLTGLPADAPLEIDATLEPPAPAVTAPSALVGQARADRPERRALEIRTQGAEEREAAADAGRLPSLALAGGYDYARPNAKIFPRAADWKTSWDVSVNLNWSLWDGGRVNAEVAESAANRRAVEERLREFDTVLESDVRQRQLDLTSALAAISSAEDGVRSATEARRVVAERFGAGVATNTDVIDAQLVLMQAELDRTRAIANARLAAARLDRALGR
jgi:outer membrane protein TolC